MSESKKTSPSWWTTLQQTRETLVFILAHMVMGTPSATIFPSRTAAEASLLCLPIAGIVSATLANSTHRTRTGSLLWGAASATCLATFGGSLLVSVVLSRTQLHHFQEPTSVARVYVEQGLQQGRIQRCTGCTLYRPSSPSSKRPSSAVVLLFFPGALMNGDVYARVAGYLTERGVTVAVIEPPAARLLAPIFGTTDRLEEIRQQVETALGRRESSQDSSSSSSLLQWAVGGHSMGSCAAEHAACHVPWIDQLVFWGSYRVPSEELVKKKVSVLAVGASNDGFGFVSKPPGARVAYLDLMNDLGWRVHEVVGGNHNGFGDYPPQTFPMQDGVRDIELHQQHKEVVATTIDFLLDQST